MSTRKKETEENLSPEIIIWAAKEQDDIVRCTHVTGTFYRCNWWTAESTIGYDNPMMRSGQIGTTHRIRKSQFLSVTKSAEGLSIRVVSGF